MQKGCSKSGDHIAKQVFPRTPDSFKHAAEHIEREHIEKEMSETSVHKQMCDWLPPAEKWRSGIEQRKGLVHKVLGESAYEKNQCVDYNKVAGDGRNKSQESAGVVSESYFHCLLFVSETQNLESSSPELIMYIILRPELVYSGLLLARSDSTRAEASGRLLGPS